MKVQFVWSARILVSLLALALFIAPLGTASADTIISTPANQNGWIFWFDTSATTGSYSYIAGPATPPLGNGSLNLSITDAAGDARPMMFTPMPGIRFDSIDALSYNTYVAPTSGDSVAITFQMDVDYDLTDATTGWQGRLVFEPYFTAPVTKGAWQTWNMLEGKWFASGEPGKSKCYQDKPCTWAEVLANFPNAGTRAAVGTISLKAGGGSINWAKFSGSVDALSITIDGTQTVYDFEPTMVTYVDDDWATVPAGTDPDGEGPASMMGVDAFSAVQPAINAVAPGGQVRIFPGDYPTGISATNVDPMTGGAGANSFIIFVNKPGLTLMGVDADNLPVETVGDVAATITATAGAPTFGYSVIFVQADDVTLQGLGVVPYIANKTVEIWGDGFTARYNHIIGDGGASFYFSDSHFDKATQTSHIQSYTVEDNHLEGGVTAASGTGYSGPVENRVIQDNVFDNVGGYAIGFRGTNPSVPWYADPVGGAVIEGNTFGSIVKANIQADGEYLNDQIDWENILYLNTFQNAVLLVDPTYTLIATDIPGSPYSFPNTRRIHTKIQPELDRAPDGHGVLVLDGVYKEDVTLPAGKTGIGLVGTGADSAIIEAAPGGSAYTLTLSSADAVVEGFTIRNSAASDNSIGVAWGYQGSGSTLNHSRVAGFPTGVYLASGLDNASINFNEITGNANGILIEGQLTATLIQNNTIAGNTLVDDYFTDKPNAAIRILSTFTGADNRIKWNDLTGSAYGIDNNSTTSINARSNWWGSKYGPTTSGTEQNIGDHILYDPWLCDGTDASPLIGFHVTGGVMCTGAPTKLIFTTQPGNGMVNQAIDPQPAVQAVDDSGNLGVLFDGNITIALGANPNSALMVGVKTLSPTDGAVEYADLALSKAGNDYTLVASAAGLTSATSATFDVGQYAADLALSLTADQDDTAQGGELTYTLTVTNDGPETAEGLKLDVTLPDGASYVDASGEDWACSEADGKVTCEQATLAAGATSTVTLVVSVTQDLGTLTTTAIVTSLDTLDANPDDNSAALDTPVMARMFFPLVFKH